MDLPSQSFGILLSTCAAKTLQMKYSGQLKFSAESFRLLKLMKQGVCVSDSALNGVSSFHSHSSLCSAGGYMMSTLGYTDKLFFVAGKYFCSVL